MSRVRRWLVVIAAGNTQYTYEVITRMAGHDPQANQPEACGLLLSVYGLNYPFAGIKVGPEALHLALERMQELS